MLATVTYLSEGKERPQLSDPAANSICCQHIQTKKVEHLIWSMKLYSFVGIMRWKIIETIIMSCFTREFFSQKSLPWFWLRYHDLGRAVLGAAYREWCGAAGHGWNCMVYCGAAKAAWFCLWYEELSDEPQLYEITMQFKWINEYSYSDIDTTIYAVLYCNLTTSVLYLYSDFVENHLILIFSTLTALSLSLFFVRPLFRAVSLFHFLFHEMYP